MTDEKGTQRARVGTSLILETLVLTRRSTAPAPVLTTKRAKDSVHFQEAMGNENAEKQGKGSNKGDTQRC